MTRILAVLLLLSGPAIFSGLRGQVGSANRPRVSQMTKNDSKTSS